MPAGAFPEASEHSPGRSWRGRDRRTHGPQAGRPGWCIRQAEPERTATGSVPGPARAVLSQWMGLQAESSRHVATMSTPAQGTGMKSHSHSSGGGDSARGQYSPESGSGSIDSRDNSRAEAWVLSTEAGRALLHEVGAARPGEPGRARQAQEACAARGRLGGRATGAGPAKGRAQIRARAAHVG